MKLTVSNLTVQFPLGRDIVTALDNVSFELAAGEFCAIVGPSGCGKSTLLRTIAGLNEPTSGSVQIHASDPTRPDQAMVFQGTSVFPWMTVLRNAAYGLEMRRVDQPERERIAGELLRQVGLGDFLNAYPRQLSEGMRQRVAIARAFAMDPEVLLMDEPFGALDEQTRLVLQDELLRIWEETGKTVVFVTHGIDEAMILADRIIVLSARPGTLKADIRVPFPRPRSIEGVRSDPEFNQLFLEIWGLLRQDAMTAIGAAR
ncbi:MAG TPA: ABC transporter ATP-binding protein [Thermomicrobiales bacterium]|nr:ABC transporter ATP-binding protein [Thermomicrobiales bacterium]